MLYRKIVKFVIYEFKIKTYKRERTLEKKMVIIKKLRRDWRSFYIIVLSSFDNNKVVFFISFDKCTLVLLNVHDTECHRKKAIYKTRFSPNHKHLNHIILQYLL